MMDLPPDCGTLTQQEAVVAVSRAAAAMPSTAFEGAAPSAIPCLVETRVGDQQVWVDKSGRYVLFGAAVDTRTGKFVNDLKSEVDAR